MNHATTTQQPPAALSAPSPQRLAAAIEFCYRACERMDAERAKREQDGAQNKNAPAIAVND